MVAAFKTFREAYSAYTDADEKYGQFVQNLPEMPAKDQIEQAQKMNDEVKELEEQVLQFKKGDELRQQYEERKAQRNAPVDSVGFGKAGDNPGKQSASTGYGDIFTAAPQIKQWLGTVAPGGHVAQGQALNSPRVEVPGNFKTLITGLSDTSAGAMVPTQYRPEIALPLRVLTLKDLITVVPTSTDSISYARITALTNNAAPVLEATSTAGAVGTKPESGFTTELVNDTVKTIAHWFPVTTRALADAPQVRAIINQFGFYGLEEELEDQIAAGSGTGEDLQGIASLSGISTQAYVTNLLTTTRKAVTKARTVHARINGWLFSLNDWEAIDLLADNEQRYYYGGPSVLGNPRLWGYPVVDSEAMADGYAYTGDFRTIVLYDREQASMAMSNSHSDFFIRNLIAVLFEMRVGLAYYRPASLVKVDLTA